jgi:hypothetical protein
MKVHLLVPQHTSGLSNTERVAFESLEIELIVLIVEDVEGSIDAYGLS